MPNYARQHESERGEEVEEKAGASAAKTQTHKPPTNHITLYTACAMASFKDQLAGFKGLRSKLEGKEVKEAAQARKARAAQQATKELGQRLLKAGATVRANTLHSTSSSTTSTEKRTLALLILVIDGLPFEAQWREWLRRQDGRTEVKVWVHAKHPEKVSSSWARERLLPTSYRPAWGSVEITRAELELLRVAVADTAGMQRFLYASESCLPLLPLDQAVDALFATATQSWVNYTNVPNNGYSNQQQFQPLINAGVPSECVWKADQWVALTRAHAEALLALPKAFGQEVWSLFKGVSASDEMYFPTCLAVLGELGAKATTAAAAAAGEGKASDEGATSNGSSTNSSTANEGEATAPSESTSQPEQNYPPRTSSSSSSSGNVLKHRLTYCHWGDSPKSPETYQGLPAEVLKKGVEEGCLLIRKFKAGSLSLDEWLRHMQTQEGGGEGGREGGVYADGGGDAGAGGKKEEEGKGEGNVKRERGLQEEEEKEGGEGTTTGRKRQREEECPGK